MTAPLIPLSIKYENKYITIKKPDSLTSTTFVIVLLATNRI